MRSIRMITREKELIQKALGYVRSDRSQASEEGFKDRDWPAVQSGKVEEILEDVVNRLDDDIALIEEEQEEAQRFPEEEETRPAKRKKLRIPGGYVENGDFYDE